VYPGLVKLTCNNETKDVTRYKLKRHNVFLDSSLDVIVTENELTFPNSALLILSISRAYIWVGMHYGRAEPKTPCIYEKRSTTSYNTSSGKAARFCQKSREALRGALGCSCIFACASSGLAHAQTGSKNLPDVILIHVGGGLSGPVSHKS
jgi:hypothetical protein